MTPSTRRPTLKELFDRAIQVENQARALYQELAERFSHHPESAALWKALAADEEAHARVLTEALEAATPEDLARPAPADVWANVAEISRLMSQDMLGTIKNLRDAYELAHQLEFSEVNVVFEFLSVDAIPGKVEREFIRTHIVMHQKKLTDFSQRYSDQDWRAVIPQ